MGSCSEDLLKRDTIVQSEFEFDGLFKNYNFFSFKIACMRDCTTVVKAEFNLPYNSANVRPAVIKSLPNLFMACNHLKLYLRNMLEVCS